MMSDSSVLDLLNSESDSSIPAQSDSSSVLDLLQSDSDESDSSIPALVPDVKKEPWVIEKVIDGLNFESWI